MSTAEIAFTASRLKRSAREINSVKAVVVCPENDPSLTEALGSPKRWLMKGTLTLKILPHSCPDLLAQCDIVRNAVDITHALGIARLKVACLPTSGKTNKRSDRRSLRRRSKGSCRMFQGLPRRAYDLLADKIACQSIT